jgi:hypothetical protein
MKKDMDGKLSYLYHSSMFYLQPLISLFLILDLISGFILKTDASKNELFCGVEFTRGSIVN